MQKGKYRLVTAIPTHGFDVSAEPVTAKPPAVGPQYIYISVITPPPRVHSPDAKGTCHWWFDITQIRSLLVAVLFKSDVFYLLLSRRPGDW